MNRTDPPYSWGTFTEVLSYAPDQFGRILAEHVPAANGRCQACTEGGTGIPHAPWPCGVQDVAARAARIALARERGQRLRRERAG